MKWHFNGRDTHVLVYSMEYGEKLAGSFLRLNEGTSIKSLELSTYEGSLVETNLQYIGPTH